MKDYELKTLRHKFFKMALPAVLGMLVSALYVILDGIFVGKGLGEAALGATNVVFPINMLVISLTMLIAIGGANVYSFYKGKGDLESAGNVFALSMSILIVGGVLIGAAAYLLRSKLTYLLGARGEMQRHAVSYLKWLAFVVPLHMTAFGLNVFVRNDNRPKLVMTAGITGSLINAVLDYYLILVLKKGIEFSAMTNGIGAVIEILITGTHFFKKDKTLHLKMPKFNLFDIKRLTKNGVPSFLSEFSTSTIILSFNMVIVKKLGESGIAAFSVVSYIGSLAIMLMIGITNGAQPLMSLNHGMGNEKAVRYIKKLGSYSNVVIGVLFGLICLFNGKFLVALFHSGNHSLELQATKILKYYILGYIPVGLTLMNILYFQTTEHNRLSTISSLIRCIGFVQVFVFILPYFFGIKFLFLSFVAGEICNLAFTFVLVKRHSKN